MDVRILGSLEVVCAGGRVTIGRRQERSLLTVLALEAGRPVAASRLIDLIWGDDPPAAAREALQTYVSRLRGVLSRAGEPPSRLVRRADAYLLDLAPGRVDAHRFDALVRNSRQIPDPDERARMLTEALELWRGPALADVVDEGTRAALTAHLDYQRTEAFDLRVRADLDAGRHEEVIAELVRAVQAEPLDERLVNSLMLALHRSGRTAEALAEYQRLRESLADATGMGPGGELTATFRAILESDRPVSADARPPAGRGIVPWQLPPDIVAFAGRTGELSLLARAAEEAAVVTVVGPGGLGKTALAVHFGHQRADLFPDGQLYVNLRGFGPAAASSPAEALRELLEGLGVAARDLPSSVAAQTALYRSLVADRRMLIVLDNARDAAQVRPLLPGRAGCLTVVTSREDLAGLVVTDAARPVVLPVLSDIEARWVLTERIGPARVVAEPDVAADVVRRCAGLPLAVSIVAARAATRPHEALDRITADLRRNPRTLEGWPAGDPATELHTVFSWSYDYLSAPAARLFRLISGYVGPHFDLAAAASTGGIALAAAQACLDELVSAHLVTPVAAGRFVLHDLLHAYATERCAELDAPADRVAARDRRYDHYVQSLDGAGRMLYPTARLPKVPQPLPGVVGAVLADEQAARTWCEQEFRVIVAMIVDAADHDGPDAAAVQLARTIAAYLDRAGHWPERLTSATAALSCAERMGDVEAAANLHVNLGFGYAAHNLHEDADRHLQAAYSRYGDLADLGGQARALVGRAHALGPQGRYAEAADQADAAVTLYRRAGAGLGLARALNAAGWCRAQLDQLDQALEHCTEALQLMRAGNDPHGEAATLDSLGYIEHRAGRPDTANGFFTSAIAMYRALGDVFHEAESLMNMARNEYDAHRAEEAGRLADEALAVMLRHEHPAVEIIRAMRPS